MHYKHIFRISLLLLVYLGTPLAKEIRNCNFEDTVDLSNAHRFANGSFLYGDDIMILPDQVGIYDYEEVFDGKRIPLDPHPRGCLCKGGGQEGERRCIKFCCQQPTRERISNNTRQCESTRQELTYTPFFDIGQENGSSFRADITKDFIVVQGIPCANAYPLELETVGPEKWNLYQNGSLSIFNGEVFLTKRDYCMMFAPKENDKELILTPMLCPVRVTNDEPALNIFSSLADIISTVFIVLTIFVYFVMPEFQNLQGNCLKCFLASLALGSATLSLISLPNVVFPKFICGFMGYAGYFFFLTSFCWLNVICYDMFRNVQAPNAEVDAKRQFSIYSAYACGLPLCLTMILIIIQVSNMPNEYKSGIGSDYCWFDPYNWSAVIYHYGVNAVLLCFDISFYFVIVLTLRSNLKSQPGSKDILFSLKSANQYGLLLLIMIVSCCCDTIANIETVTESESASVWFYISSFVSTIYGLMIFLAFALEPLNRWRHRRRCLRKGYANEDADIKNFESIEISSQVFS